jgi:hypothetical protein
MARCANSMPENRPRVSTVFNDERPASLREGGLRGPTWAVFLTLLLGVAASSRSCEDSERIAALAEEQRKASAQLASLTKLLGDSRRWERWSEVQQEMQDLKEKYEESRRIRLAARGVEIAPGRFIQGDVAAISARRAAALEDLAHFDALEKSGAHGPPGVYPSFLEVLNESATTSVRNKTERELSVRVWRYPPDGSTADDCNLYVSATREGAYGLMPIRPGTSLLYVVNTRICRYGGSMVPAFEVRDASGLVWASDPVLERLRAEVRADIADLDLALAASR